VKMSCSQGDFHTSAWKVNSANFAFTEFYEVHMAPVQHLRAYDGLRYMILFACIYWAMGVR
jgi:hypothetical protein